MIPTVLAPSLSKGFDEQLKLIDPKLHAAFNCEQERWQIFRWTKRGDNTWVMTVQNDNHSFRPLDGRTLKKLRNMDIIARWGSVANYEAHLDEKMSKYKSDMQKESDHEMKCNIKDDKVLWQRAIENAKSGRIG
jgi:hypothetical protein